MISLFCFYTRPGSGYSLETELILSNQGMIGCTIHKICRFLAWENFAPSEYPTSRKRKCLSFVVWWMILLSCFYTRPGSGYSLETELILLNQGMIGCTIHKCRRFLALEIALLHLSSILLGSGSRGGGCGDGGVYRRRGWGGRGSG